MNKKRWVRLLVLVGLVSFTACSREAQPSISPVGAWQGTPTTLSGGSGTQPFAAKIDLAEAGTYEGSLRVGAEVYRAVGGYNPYIGENHFALRTSPAERDAALSPGPPFYGVEWYGELTDNSWEGKWYLRTEDGNKVPGRSLQPRAPPLTHPFFASSGRCKMLLMSCARSLRVTSTVSPRFTMIISSTPMVTMVAASSSQ